jgi:imidazolonepropionase-like amidohydrolase
MVPGFSLHDEPAALVWAGLTPYEALKTATVNPAKFLNTDRGTLERGKRADAVLLDENPLDDITHTSRITGVLLNGRWLRRADIDKIPETKDGRCSAALRTTR